MPHVLFSHDPSQLTAMARCLPRANLAQLHHTVEELTDLSCKTGVVAQTVFELVDAAMKRTDELSNQEMLINLEICHLREEVNGLMIEKEKLTPDQIAQALDDLQKKIDSCVRPSTHSLRHELRSLENLWNHLHFVYTFPVADELNPDSFISNYLHRMSHRIKQARFADPKRAAHLQMKLKDLQRQSLAAEQIFCGKGDRLYRQLPKEVHLAVQQRIFAHDPDSMKSRPSPEILAGAIMADLADRMIS
jgi:hypothetical protein